ncbi:MAG TPA: NrfD/PsrC family molybdoenzyme membrane anchor subunit [Bryobacteraceae bacterium]|nr:NrfD/PsrC family molybdoenzyme membrane anchor subunit [Bryobacteraceae bacterium]
MPDQRRELAELEDLPPVIAPGTTPEGLTDQVSHITLKHPRTVLWLGLLTAAGVLLVMFLSGVTWLLLNGVGVWGINIPVGWGIAIGSFVWWIGIGHAGTLISAILLLLHQEWRNSINRLAEAMTLFAVMCAGTYPLLHMGRPWLFYWLIPYPNNMSVWPQFRSPLVWDVFAVSTYFTVSLIFWYSALIPDFATLRDKATNRAHAIIYGMLSLGWRGSAAHWQRFQMAYLLLGGLATPLVLSVHTVVSFDFAVALVPGWHSTIFPPYFVAGAIFSGFAMVLMLAIPIRRIWHLENLVTERHLDNMAKVILGTGMIVAYAYAIEIFMAWYSADSYEQFLAHNRMAGPYAPVYWGTILSNVLSIQALWFARVRRHPLALFAISLVVQTGMWLERYMIVVTSLHRDFLPRSWGMYAGTIYDWIIFVGTWGLFLTFFLLFLRYVPMITMFEMRETAHRANAGGGHA